MFVFRCKDSTVKNCVGMMARKSSRGPQSPRRSPVRGSASPTGHYAGCKWTEPPLPSALPPPPQHWMQAPHTRPTMPFRQTKSKSEQRDVAVADIENQLKVLLKVQA